MKILFYTTKTLMDILFIPVTIVVIPAAICYFLSETLEEYISSKKYNGYNYSNDDK